MSTPIAMQLSANMPGSGLAACWTLSSDRAVMLGAQSGGFLQVDHGTVWLTLDGPHQGPANDWGDLVLKSGTRIHVTAGQHVVLEHFRPAANEAVCFSWEPDAVASIAPLGRFRCALRATGSVLRRAVGALGQWLAPGPAWPHDLEREYANIKDEAWRNLYHLRINPP
ncbi:MAG: DUF2917 domain-containing protein [Betaproteobacteria bacterium]